MVAVLVMQSNKEFIWTIAFRFPENISRLSEIKVFSKKPFHVETYHLSEPRAHVFAVYGPIRSVSLKRMPWCFAKAMVCMELSSIAFMMAELQLDLMKRKVLQH